jgi:hypothetical protein
MFERMIELIEKHASYGPAMKEAARGKEPLILDYHTHGRGTGYCVSIAKKKHNPLRILGQAEPLEELVHIKGVGQEEADCGELMGALGRELVLHYQLQLPPLVYLNGMPHPAKNA